MTPCEAECRRLAAACFSAAWLGNGGGGSEREMGHSRWRRRNQERFSLLSLIYLLLWVFKRTCWLLAASRCFHFTMYATLDLWLSSLRSLPGEMDETDTPRSKRYNEDAISLAPSTTESIIVEGEQLSD